MRAYDTNIDKAVFKILYEQEKVSSRELKEEVEECSRNGKNISSALFAFHLTQMLISDQKYSRYLVSPVIDKKDCGRGKKIFYSLTNKARIRMNLKLPILREESTREKAYQLFLLFMSPAGEAPANSATFTSEEEFDSFLYKMHISKKDLLPIKVENGINLRKIPISKYKKQNVIEEPITITTFSNQQEEESDIAIFRIDYLKGSENEGSFYYVYRLRGISKKEALNYRQSNAPFSHIELIEDKINDCFNLLEKEGLIKRITFLTLEYLDEIRYDIANEDLRKFLVGWWLMHGRSVIRMYLTWKYRSPTKEEETWWTLIWGEKRAKLLLKDLHRIRHERKQLQPEQLRNRDAKLMEEIQSFERDMPKDLDKLKKEHSKVLVDYTLFTDALLEWVYPNFLRKLQENKKV